MHAALKDASDTAIFTEDGRKLAAKTKKGKPRLIRTISENVLEVDEAEKFKELRKAFPHAEDRIDELDRRYARLTSGETLEASDLGYAFRKARGKVKHVLKTEYGSANRAAAKIAVELLYLVLPHQKFFDSPDIEELRKFALRGIPLSAVSIGQLPNALKPDYFHRATIELTSVGIFIDIMFFGFAQYRIIIGMNEAILSDSDRLQLPEAVGLICGFVPGEPKVKLLGRRMSGSAEEWEPADHL